VGGETLGLVGTCLLDELGRHATPYLVRTNLGALQHQGAGGHDGSLAHLGVVEHGGAHADEGTAADGAGMHGGIVAYRHVVLDDGRAYLVGHVHAGAVLHVHAVAHVYVGHVAAHYGIEPDGAFVAHLHFAHNGGVLAEVAFFAPFRCEAFHGFYQCHFSFS